MDGIVRYNVYHMSCCRSFRGLPCPVAQVAEIVTMLDLDQVRIHNIECVKIDVHTGFAANWV